MLSTCRLPASCIRAHVGRQSNAVWRSDSSAALNLGFMWLLKSRSVGPEPFSSGPTTLQGLRLPHDPPGFLRSLSSRAQTSWVRCEELLAGVFRIKSRPTARAGPPCRFHVGKRHAAISVTDVDDYSRPRLALPVGGWPNGTAHAPPPPFGYGCVLYPFVGPPWTARLRSTDHRPRSSPIKYTDARYSPAI